MKLTANAFRSGRWWAVEVPEIPGLVTQARTLAEVPAMVLDAASALTNRPERYFNAVNVRVRRRRDFA